MSFLGRFVWHDLMTTDLEKAEAFYTSLFGWKVQEFDMGMGPYKMLLAGEQGVGGMVQLDPAQAPGVPTHWMGYVEVENAEESMARGEAGGGKRCTPVIAIPDVGKFGVLTDPQGGVFAPFEHAPKERPPLPDVPPPGTFCWNECHSTDPAASLAYYSSLFGWTSREMPMGDSGMYHVLANQDGKDVAGVMPSPSGHHAWLHYIASEDVDATAAQAAELGATTVCEPADIPNVGRFAVLLDPTGGVFALFQGTRG